MPEVRRTVRRPDRVSLAAHTMTPMTRWSLAIAAVADVDVSRAYRARYADHTNENKGGAILNPSAFRSNHNKTRTIEGWQGPCFLPTRRHARRRARTAKPESDADTSSPTSAVFCGT